MQSRAHTCGSALVGQNGTLAKRFVSFTRKQILRIPRIRPKILLMDEFSGTLNSLTRSHIRRQILSFGEHPPTPLG